MGKGIKMKDVNGNEIFPCPYYPVGSIYMSVLNVNPTNYFGGTWEQIKDVFLLASGDTYKVGSTGGSATKIIDQSNLPSRVMVRESVSNKYACGCNSNQNGWANICLTDAGFTNSQPMNIMPPYLAIYVWKRTE